MFLQELNNCDISLDGVSTSGFHFPVKNSGSDVGGSGKLSKKSQNKMKQKINNLNKVLREPQFKNIISEDGSILPPSSVMYKNISDSLDCDNKLEPKYIYTILKLNRYNVYSELLDFFNIEIPSNSSFPTNTSLDSTSNNCFRFTIDLTEIWPSMKPEIKAHNFRTGSRVIRSLKSNSWTHVLYEEIHNYTKIPCALNFKSSQVSSSGVFVTVNGQCSECPCRLNIKKH